MILEHFAETAVFDFGFDNLVNLQAAYTPKVEEVFRDDEVGDYWYVDKADIWFLAEDDSTPVRKTGFTWNELVVNYGPMVYVGIKSDFDFNEG